MRIERAHRAWISETPSGRPRLVPLNKVENRVCDIVEDVEQWIAAGRSEAGFSELVWRAASRAFGAQKKHCAHCGRGFLVGRGTGKRGKRASYCSNACRVAAQRARNAT